MVKIVSILLALVFVVVTFIGPAEAQVEKAELTILGMSCSICAYGLHKKLSALEGIKEAKIDFETESGILTFKRGAIVDYGQIEKAVREGGFTLKKMSLEAIGRVEKKKGLFFVISGTEQLLPLKIDEESCTLVREKTSTMKAGEKSKLMQVAGEFVKMSNEPKEGKNGEKVYFNIRSCKPSEILIE